MQLKIYVFSVDFYSGKYEIFVFVIVQECDWRRGYVCGTMAALDVPDTKEAVTTFWEGEIVDNINHSFMTSKVRNGKEARATVVMANGQKKSLWD